MKITTIHKFPELAGWRYQGWVAKVQAGQSQKPTQDGDSNINGGGYPCLAVLDRNKIVQKEMHSFERKLKRAIRRSEERTGISVGVKNKTNSRSVALNAPKQDKNKS